MNDKWEYKIFFIGNKSVFARKQIEHIEAELNTLGQEGWEAWSHTSYAADLVYYFKRKISEWAN